MKYYDEFKDRLVTLYKLKSKNKSPRGYPDRYEVIHGIVSLNKHGCLFFTNTKEWFRTSPVVNIKKVKDGYRFETNNSFYKIKVVE